MPAARASSKSSLPKGGTEQVLGEGHAGVAASVSRMRRTLAGEAEFWLSSELDFVADTQRFGHHSQSLPTVKGR